jgi:DNA-binding NarL/FixJ family response regulator
MIRVLIVDDHPAVRAGVWSMLRVEPGLQPAGAVSDADEALERTAAVSPDVVLVDYRLQDGNGLLLCHRLHKLPGAPRVLVYSAYSETELAVPAFLAGASGVLSKGATPDALVEAIRSVARGRRVFRPIRPEHVQAAATRLSPDDLPVLGMLVQGTPLQEVATTLGLSPEQLTARLYAMIARLAPAREPVAG